MDLRRFLVGKRRKILLLLFDMVCFSVINLMYLIAVTNSKYMTAPDMQSFTQVSLLLFVSLFVVRILLRVYVNVWRYTSTHANLILIISDLTAMLISAVVVYLTMDRFGVWHVLIVSAFHLILAQLSRFVYRLSYKRVRLGKNEEKPHVNVAIAGADQLGVLLANELRCNKKSIYYPMFFIDNDKAKAGGTISGLPVCRETDVTKYIEKYSVSEIFIARNDLDSDMATRLYDFYSKTGCKVKIYDTPIREMPVKQQKPVIREFEIEDLLFRNPLSVSGDDTFAFYGGKTVLVTGGGGSIGSELCRQIAKCSPERLIILDIYENNAYEIQQELIRRYGDELDLHVEIASVRDRERLDNIFAHYRPDVVFHAAAHKHVPLMEHSSCEAIKNNVFGTRNVADISEKYGVGKFILISTDKAVNPTNIMGASKRLCEMIVQSRHDSATTFSAVRFGNVLGSNGSVIPLFKQQIANGGPITITDKRIIRYFMTIPEASQLVMKAGAMAKNGELFVLDMGKPVRIYDLAVNMIRLSGLEPDIDIKIEEIGLRPGEKLYEELLIKTETLIKTDDDMIFIERDAPLSRQMVDEKLLVLDESVKEAECKDDTSFVKTAVRAVCPTYRDPDEINLLADCSDEMMSWRKSGGHA